MLHQKDRDLFVVPNALLYLVQFGYYSRAHTLLLSTSKHAVASHHLHDAI